jgi:hypothetical protein
MTLHKGTLFAGVIYFGVAIALILEALGFWTLQIGDLRYLGPIALVVLGVAVTIGSMGASREQS